MISFLFILVIGLLVIFSTNVNSFCITQRSPYNYHHRQQKASRQFSTSTTVQPTTTSLDEDDVLELRETYKIIATRDPEWLNEFVLEILDDEDDEDIRSILQQAAEMKIKEQTTKTTKATTTAKAKAVESRKVSKTLSPSMPVQGTKKEREVGKLDKKPDRVINASLQNVTSSNDLPLQNKTKELMNNMTATDKSSSSVTTKNKISSPKSKGIPKESSPMLKQLPKTSNLTVTLSVGKENKTTLLTDNLLPKEEKNQATAANQTGKLNEPFLFTVSQVPNVTSKVASLIQTNNTNKSEATITTTISSNVTDKIVVFTDSRLKKKQSISLSILNSLGYSVEEILALDPDALSLIVEDKLRKPSTGVPVSWKTNKALIQIVTSDNLMKDDLESTSIGNVTTSFNTKSMTRSTDSRVQTRQSDSKQSSRSSTALENRVERKQTAKDIDRPSMRQESRSSEKDKTNRRIYTGRPEPNQPRDDPPPPKAFWPDIDTFRSLLRKEASMRLRILGDGWSQTVKDESEWRLGLYKNWLWTLHTGLGDPIVESRSDRMRRNSRENAQTKPKTTKSDSSNNSQRRRGRDD